MTKRGHTMDKDKIVKDFGDFIKQKRIERGLSQGETAKLLGISQAAYCRYENGQILWNRDIHTATLAKHRPQSKSLCGITPKNAKEPEQSSPGFLLRVDIYKGGESLSLTP